MSLLYVSFIIFMYNIPTFAYFVTLTPTSKSPQEAQAFPFVSPWPSFS